MPSVVLCSICLIAALLLSVINIFTSQKISENQEKNTNSAFTEILPGATGKETLTLNESYPEAVVEGYKFDNGFVFKMSVSGYKDGLIIMCGIDLDGKITGVKHIQTNETYGMEAELNKAYVGDTAESLELILATGATKSSKSSKAYYDAMSAALNGGEDYRLLFTIPIGKHDKFRHDFQTFDVIGHLAKPEVGAAVVTPDGVELPIKAQGWKNE